MQLVNIAIQVMLSNPASKDDSEDTDVLTDFVWRCPDGERRNSRLLRRNRAESNGEDPTLAAIHAADMGPLAAGFKGAYSGAFVVALAGQAITARRGAERNSAAISVDNPT